MARNFAQIKAIEKKNKERILQVNPTVTDNSGIYFLTRIDENGIRFGYIGQARRLLSRLANHLSGYQHIDLSLKKHGLYKEENPYGWKIDFIECSVDELDEKEKFYIKKYADEGYQLRNKTAGGQGEGKTQIDDYKPSKGYRDGLEQGRRNASKEIKHLFDLHLTVTTKNNPPTANQRKALEKFNEFLNYYEVTKQGS